MSKVSGGTNDRSTTGGQEFSCDQMLEVLSNQRRRFAIHALKQHEGKSITVSELAEHVASWENGKPIEQLTYRERKRVRNAIRQFHLPKMDNYGFIEYDAQRGTVTLTEAATSTDFYIDSLTGNEIPWSTYYLGISALSTISFLGIWAELFPFSILSPFLWGVFFVTVLTVSSLWHCYDNYYRMRLGTQGKPLEVHE